MEQYTEASASSMPSMSKKMDLIEKRYMELEVNKIETLERAEEAARLTIPSIFPRRGLPESSALPKPWQAVGARAVNNLSNKLLLTLFPVSSPFFKLEIPEGALQQAQEENPKVKEEVEAKLSEQENIIQSDLETSNFRTKNFEILRSLVVTGNMLMFIPKKGEPEVFRLDKYVVKRTARGDVLEIIVKQTISKEELLPEWTSQLTAAKCMNSSVDGKPGDYCLYTVVKLDGKWFREQKYISGIALEGTEAKYKKESSAWLPLRWNGLSGEDYGRSYVDEYIGDLVALEGISRAIQEHSAIASHTYFLVRPGSRVSMRDLSSVPNGGSIPGEEGDITVPQVGKGNDMSIAKSMYDDLKATISQAFLLTQVRDSERTTAEEIRLLANELETALGGAYSLLAHSFQKPLLSRQIERLTQQGLLVKLNNKDIEPKVIVGLEGLGRGTDLEKLLKAGMALEKLAPLAQITPRFDMVRAVNAVFNGVGLDPNDVLHTEEEMAEKAQAEQQNLQREQAGEIMKASAGPIAGQMAKGAIENPEATQNALQGAQEALQQQPEQG